MADPGSASIASIPDRLGLRVRDLRAMEAFYVHLLGFEVEWRPDAAHVHLAWRGDRLVLEEAELIAPRGALAWLGLAYPRPGEVEALAQRLADAGVRVVAAPQLHPDGVFRCEVCDPEGNLIRLLAVAAP